MICKGWVMEKQRRITIKFKNSVESPFNDSQGSIPTPFLSTLNGREAAMKEWPVTRHPWK